ncbi:hypothetical protein [Burkholderia sp. Bp9142]|uniref:hypothetical protein n=1 Tax=Burkholderia sp. Bp9142 TaxID=2184573 RepID=UPI000F5B0D78|nr:hypothetical protein [Burkholderia sp. Bp9142]
MKSSGPSMPTRRIVFGEPTYKHFWRASWRWSLDGRLSAMPAPASTGHSWPNPVVEGSAALARSVGIGMTASGYIAEFQHAGARTIDNVYGAIDFPNTPK